MIAIAAFGYIAAALLLIYHFYHNETILAVLRDAREKINARKSWAKYGALCVFELAAALLIVLVAFIWLPVMILSIIFHSK